MAVGIMMIARRATRISSTYSTAKPRRTMENINDEDDPLDQSIIVDDSALAQRTQTPDVWFRSGDKRNLQDVFGQIANEDDSGAAVHQPPDDEDQPAAKKRAAIAMRVLIRIRPTKEPIETIQIVSASKIRTETKEYEFSAILSPEMSQVDTYDTAIRPYISGLLNGQSAMVFCYGRTNAGKTYTVMGDLADEPHWGLVPRVLHDLLRHRGTVNLASFEVYNEVIYDLLPGGSAPIREHLLLRNVTEHPITSTIEINALLEKTIKARTTANNQFNSKSSRSHAVLRITLPKKKTPDEPPTHLWIVDLAGSEKAKRAKLWQEAVKINKSLNVLNRCFLALREGKTPPFRDSKLTHILGNHWKSENATRTTMLVNIGCGQSETVLHYASVAAKAVISLPVVDQLQQKQQKPQYDCNGRIKRTFTNVIRKLSPKRRAVALPAAAAKQPPAQPQPFDYEERLEELQEVIRECEDEMTRMRNTHLEEMEELMANAQDETGRQVQAIQQRYEAIIIEKDAQITFLQETLDQLQGKFKSDQEHYQTNVVEAMETEHQEALAEKDNTIDALREQVARLEEELLQEASAKQPTLVKDNDTEEEPKEKVESAKTSLVLGHARDKESSSTMDEAMEGTTKREEDETEPLLDVVASGEGAELNPPSSLDSNINHHHRPLEPLSSNYRFFKPPGRLRLDPATGTYRRPRGKAPRGASHWDELKGVWLLAPE